MTAPWVVMERVHWITYEATQLGSNERRKFKRRW